MNLPAALAQAADPLAGFRDIAGPVAIPPSPWWVAAPVAAAIAAVALAFFLVRRARRPRPTPPPSPRDRAVMALGILRSRAAEFAPRPFSTEVSDVVRRFAEEHYGFRATRQTTPEFLAAIAPSHRLALADKRALQEFLDACDRAKYAPENADPADNGRLLDAAAQFVQHADAQPV
jgi:hypothetical protein